MSSSELSLADSKRSLLALWNDRKQDEVLFVLQVIMPELMVPGVGEYGIVPLPCFDQLSKLQQGKIYVALDGSGIQFLKESNEKCELDLPPHINAKHLDFNANEAEKTATSKLIFDVAVQQGYPFKTVDIQGIKNKREEAAFKAKSLYEAQPALIPAVILSPNIGKAIIPKPLEKISPVNFSPLIYEQEKLKLLPLEAQGTLILHSPHSTALSDNIRYAFRVTEENGVEIRDPHTNQYFPLYSGDQNGWYRISEQFKVVDRECRKSIEADRRAVELETKKRKQDENKKIDHLKDDVIPLISESQIRSGKAKGLSMSVEGLKEARKSKDQSEEKSLELQEKAKYFDLTMMFIHRAKELNDLLIIQKQKSPDLEEQIKNEKVGLAQKFKVLGADEIKAGLILLYQQRINQINEAKATALEKNKELIQLEMDIRSFLCTMKSIELEEQALSPIDEVLKGVIEQSIRPEIKKLQDQTIAPLQFYLDGISHEPSSEGVLLKAVIYLKIKMGVPLCELIQNELTIVELYPCLKEANLLGSLKRTDRIALQKLIGEYPQLSLLLEKIDGQVPGFFSALCETALPEFPSSPSLSHSLSSSSPSLSHSLSSSSSSLSHSLSSSSSSFSHSLSSSSSSLTFLSSHPVNAIKWPTGRLGEIRTYIRRFEEINGSNIPLLQKLQQLKELEDKVRLFIPGKDGKSKLEEYEVQAEGLMKSIEKVVNQLQQGPNEVLQIEAYERNFNEIIDSEAKKFQKIKQLMVLKEKVKPFLPKENHKSELKEYEVRAEELMKSIESGTIGSKAEFMKQVIKDLNFRLETVLDRNEIEVIEKIKIAIYLENLKQLNLDDNDKKSLDNDGLLDFLMSITVKVPELQLILAQQIISSNATELQKLQRLYRLRSHIRLFEDSPEGDEVLKLNGGLMRLIRTQIQEYQKSFKQNVIKTIELFLAGLESNYIGKARYSFLGVSLTLPVQPSDSNVARIAALKTTVAKIIICLKIWAKHTTIELTEAEIALVEKCREGNNRSLEQGKLLDSLSLEEKAALQDSELQKILRDIVPEVPELQSVLAAASRQEAVAPQKSVLQK